VITEGIWAAHPSIPRQALPSLGSLSSLNERLGLLRSQSPARAGFFILMGLSYSAGRAYQQRRSAATRPRPALTSH
jgi:hypothetical protein